MTYSLINVHSFVECIVNILILKYFIRTFKSIGSRINYNSVEMNKINLGRTLKLNTKSIKFKLWKIACK